VPPVPPPSSGACVGPFIYNGENPFSLPDYGNATELEYVRTHVSMLLVGPVRTEFGEDAGTSWTSDGDYPVVIVKSATSAWLYTNVVKGQILQSPAFNQNGKQQAISYVSRYTCP